MTRPTQPPEDSGAWNEQQLTDPHRVPDKAARVQRMFAAIADSYDLNNRVHSLWRDQAWRRRVVELCDMRADDVVVDVACGTGDLALAFADAEPNRVVGIDFTHPMLRVADRKRSEHDCPCPVDFIAGDATRLPLRDQSADVVSIAFGIRNVVDPAAAAAEFHRVLRRGGRAAILEFSLPTNPLLRAVYQFYFSRIMPITATLLSGDRSGAYRYLPRSVNTFLDRSTMVEMLETVGFGDVRATPLTFGIAVAYIGVKAG